MEKPAPITDTNWCAYEQDGSFKIPAQRAGTCARFGVAQSPSCSPGHLAHASWRVRAHRGAPVPRTSVTRSHRTHMSLHRAGVPHDSAPSARAAGVRGRSLDTCSPHWVSLAQGPWMRRELPARGRLGVLLSPQTGRAGTSESAGPLDERAASGRHARHLCLGCGSSGKATHRSETRDKPEDRFGLSRARHNRPPKVAVPMFIKGRDKNGFLKHLRNDAFTYVTKDVSIMKLLLGTTGQ